MVTVPQLGEELQPVGWGLADSLRVGVGIGRPRRAWWLGVGVTLEMVGPWGGGCMRVRVPGGHLWHWPGLSKRISLGVVLRHSGGTCEAFVHGGSRGQGRLSVGVHLLILRVSVSGM